MNTATLAPTARKRLPAVSAWFAVYSQLERRAFMKAASKLIVALAFVAAIGPASAATNGGRGNAEVLNWTVGSTAYQTIERGTLSQFCLLRFPAEATRLVLLKADEARAPRMLEGCK